MGVTRGLALSWGAQRSGAPHRAWPTLSKPQTPVSREGPSFPWAVLGGTGELGLTEATLDFSACDLLKVMRALSPNCSSIHQRDATDTSQPAWRNSLVRRHPRSAPPNLLTSGLAQRTRLRFKFSGFILSTAILQQRSTADIRVNEHVTRQGIFHSVHIDSHLPALWLFNFNFNWALIKVFFIPLLPADIKRSERPPSPNQSSV